MSFLLVIWRPAAIGQVALALLAAGIANAQDTTVAARVRSESPTIAAAIAEGIERSAAFRRLVEMIGATDGIVYVQEGSCRRSSRACLHLSVGVAGSYRFLRILVSTRKAPGCQLVASIGHELQHAVEVLANPKVRSTFDMFLFFDRTAPVGWRDSFETDEAIRAGLQVDKEMCR